MHLWVRRIFWPQTLSWKHLRNSIKNRFIDIEKNDFWASAGAIGTCLGVPEVWRWRRCGVADLVFNVTLYCNSWIHINNQSLAILFTFILWSSRMEESEATLLKEPVNIKIFISTKSWLKCTFLKIIDTINTGYQIPCLLLQLKIIWKKTIFYRWLKKLMTALFY